MPFDLRKDDGDDTSPMSMDDVTPDTDAKPLPSETIKKRFGGSEGGLEMREPKEEK